jgi:hypothetical protein
MQHPWQNQAEASQNFHYADESKKAHRYGCLAGQFRGWHNQLGSAGKKE